jgi:hypothetical protein
VGADLQGKGAPGSHRGYSGLGEAGNQRLDDGRGRGRAEAAPGGIERWQSQREHEQLGGLVGGRAERQGDRDRAIRGARPAPHLRQALPQERGIIEQMKFLVGHSSIQTIERYLGSEQEIELAVNENLGL